MLDSEIGFVKILKFINFMIVISIMSKLGFGGE